MSKLMNKKIIAILRNLFLLNWSYAASVGEGCFISLLCAEMPIEIPHSVCQRIESRIEMLNDEYITIYLHCEGMICYSLLGVQMKISKLFWSSIYFMTQTVLVPLIRIICACTIYKHLVLGIVR